MADFISTMSPMFHYRTPITRTYLPERERPKGVFSDLCAALFDLASESPDDVENARMWLEENVKEYGATN